MNNREGSPAALDAPSPLSPGGQPDLPSHGRVALPSMCRWIPRIGTTVSKKSASLLRRATPTTRDGYLRAVADADLPTPSSLPSVGPRRCQASRANHAPSQGGSLDSSSLGVVEDGRDLGQESTSPSQGSTVVMMASARARVSRATDAMALMALSGSSPKARGNSPTLLMVRVWPRDARGPLLARTKVPNHYPKTKGPHA